MRLTFYASLVAFALQSIYVEAVSHGHDVS